jgi:glyoxylase-like metal-dependent hydrolase (beta-lactamase superfamily II)
MTASRLRIEHFFDEPSSTFSYLVLDRVTRRCALIDTVRGYDAASGRTGTAGADRIADRVRELGATVEWLLETHVHADHLTAAQPLRSALGGTLAIGDGIAAVQRTFGELFGAGADFARDGSQFDRVFADGDTFAIGGLRGRVMHTPGHTPSCVTYVVEDADTTVAFVGDTLFLPDQGTARCDFPGGDAATLYRSIRRVLALPPRTLLHACHDYRPGGRPLRHVSTVAEQRAANIHLRDGIDEATFVAMRRARDATLAVPALMLPAVQVNMRAGQLPPAEANGLRYLKIPIDAI